MELESFFAGITIVISLCSLVIAIYGMIQSRKSADAAINQANIASKQSAHAEMQSKSAFKQAEAALITINITQLEKRLKIYEGINTIRVKLIQSSPKSLQDDDILWPFKGWQHLSDFYFEDPINIELSKVWDQLCNLCAARDEWINAIDDKLARGEIAPIRIKANTSRTECMEKIDSVMTSMKLSMKSHKTN